MTCLLYGVVFSSSGEPDGGPTPLVLPPGVGAAAVRLVEEGGLGAAVSMIDPADLTPNVARVLSFAKVVEALHAHRTVLPMRYGCLLGDEGQLVDLLRDRGEEYAAILQGLDGCVEMGVRVLLSAEACAPRTPVESAPRPASGRDYLTERAARSTREETFVRALAAAKERVLGALGGLAERTETDRDSRMTPRFASLYFLVKRDVVKSFCREFRRIDQTESVLLLSGPWPPYSFVVPDRNGNGHG
jgi:hypothetical protein